MLMRIHYNKQTVKKGLPWSIHTSKFCAQASHITFKCPVETEEKPDKKTNPRYFIKCNGHIQWQGKKAFIHA